MVCNGSEPTADVPCELGALAMDPDGGPRGGALNLTDDVIACPPSQCLTSKGCTEKVCRSTVAWAVHVAARVECSAPWEVRVGSA